MALDGALIHLIRNELLAELSGAKVDKIFEPSRDEIVLQCHTKRETKRLLLSARPGSARLGLIESLPENPKQPPMFCMLLRKRLVGAKLLDIRQLGLERALYFDFEALDELGEAAPLTLAIETMGKYSNVILIGRDGTIVDSLKRVDSEMSRERMILPGLLYRLPPPQEKLCILESDNGQILAKLSALPREMELSKGLLAVLQGVSPIVCREAAYYVGRGREVYSKERPAHEEERLLFFLSSLRETLENDSGEPYLLLKTDGTPLDFTFLRPDQYGTAAKAIRKESYSALLEAFWGERDRSERMRQRSADLLKVLVNHTERLSRKIQNQRAELTQSENREEKRICGDLLTANLCRIEKGMREITLENYYDPELKPIKIALNPALTAQQNAQKYYKDYRKAKTANEKLSGLIASAEEELSYLETVFDELSRAENENDLNEIRAELREQGYLRKQNDRRAPKEKRLPPFEFTLRSGKTVLIGRNNRGNDELTLKFAKKSDLWLHTKNIPGSHAILLLSGTEPDDRDIAEAAALAARHSRAKNSAQVPVDYAFVRYVQKPQGAKPGKVIYTHYKTVYVDPQRDF